MATRLASSRVPTTREVIPGARVNIVLKVDQPTGRTVGGVVREVLTQGEHPRGIKVRLVDGRIGRVQSLATGVKPGEDAEAVEAEAGDGEDTAQAEPAAEVEATSSFGQRGGYRGRGRGARGGGFRESRRNQQGGDDIPTQSVGLDAYIKTNTKQKKGKGKKQAENSEDQSGTAEADEPDGQQHAGLVSGGAGVTAKCPVCGEFEGDEAAVAHHVGSHFEE